VIRNIQDYLKVIEDIKEDNEINGNKSDLLFRGQGIDKPLLPKIARLRLRGEISNIEKLIMDEFERGMIPLTEFKPTTNWDLLALAQHHGLPTRLLDWSYSALVALYFAVENPPVIDDLKTQNGVVWILSSTEEDFKVDKTKSPFLTKATKIFRSSVVSRRISSQAGIFSIHGINDNGKLIALEKNKRFKSKLEKIIIPADCFSEIRKKLYILGINNYTIYPDMDGYCKHLTWRYSYYNDEK
jgi:hypothetical protein